LKFNKFLKKQNIVGVSDGLPISNAFKSRFGARYSNFEFHVEPFLDITQLKPEFESIADFVTCSEVLEHVQPPVDFAFLGLYKLLKPGGWLIFSVPHTKSGSPHIEHFPIMVNSTLIQGDIPILRGTDTEGNPQEFGNLVFHGGAGSTLEYRVFSEDSIKEKLLACGFVQLEKQGNVRPLGIIWEPWSRVWVAQKPFT
jgi:SAM-dependent methyltransferase